MRRILLIAILTLGASVANAATLEETFDRTLDVRPGAHLVVSNVNGRVTIHTSNEPRVKLHAEKKVESRDPEAARRAMAEMTIDVKADSDGVRVVTHEPRSDSNGFWSFLLGENVNSTVSFDVTVPSKMDLDISTVNGRVMISDVTGRLRAETTNGRIELARCAGTAEASTTNGAIHAEMLQVTPGRALSFETTNGRITLIIPATLAANVDAETTNGSISSDLPVTAKSIDSNTLRGAVNGGGPTLRLRTTNGGIEIRATGNQSASR